MISDKSFKMNKKNTKNVVAQLSDSDDGPVAVRKPSKDAKVAPKKAPPKKKDSDDESSEVPQPKKTIPAKAVAKKAKSDSESESPKKPVKKVEKASKKAADSDSEDEKPKKKAPAKKKESDSDSVEKPQPKNAPAKKIAESDSDDEVVPAKSNENDDDGETHTELFVKNLSYKSTEDSIYEYFSKFGTVSNVKLLTDKNTGKPKGIGFVKFESRADAKKAIENVGEVDGRTPSCSWSNDKSGAGNGNAGSFGNKGGFNKPAQPNYSGETHTIFVGNLGFKTNENTIKNFFCKAGNVVGVRIAKQEDGRAKGFCHVDFDSSDAVQKAIAYAGQQLDGREIRVDASEPRKSGGAPRGGFGGRGGRGGPPKQQHGVMGAGKKVTFDDDD